MATAAQQPRRHLARDVAQEGDALVLTGPSGETRVPLEGWEPAGRPVGTVVGLVRRVGNRSELRAVDRSGTTVGSVEVPAGRLAVATDVNIIVLPEAPHDLVRPHDVQFFSLQGAALNHVEEPSLRIVSWSPTPEGRLVTVNKGPADDEWTIVAYEPDGRGAWRYGHGGREYPEAATTRDGKRLVVLERDLTAGTASVTVLAPGNRRLARHTLPNVTQLVAAPGPSRLALVGQHVIALLDARTGKLAWRHDEDVDFVPPGGVRFDPRGSRLFVVRANRRREKGDAELSLIGLRLSDGLVEERTPLGTVSLDAMPTVVDVGAAPGDERRVTFHDRVLTLPTARGP